ncbi:DNA-binding transcriptional LysR family regulator [Rhizobium sp. BK512]|uniref:LysR substrate-binding domain-containing protein n=1 Tax=Rhizobium sp. BK512 TaxID=2587010 RepID=UPI0016156D21|nr:LysR substrate-binding domain-containing protein [Rhizobium sp. BK512]MBB3560313.1 DNA-binding transcriptional LysR family regulator [Rhizobium sp. BK512]
MARHLPPLSYLRAFEATARLGSVTRAADELGRTHGAVSKQLQLLQEQLGLPVFEKSGTGLRLNEDGAAFFTTVSRAFDLLEERYQELKSSRNEASVHLSCSATFAMVWLVPRLAEFYSLYPNCRVQLTMSSSARDAGPNRARDGVDIMLSWDRLSRPQFRREHIPLASVSFGLVSAPDYPFSTDGDDFSFPARISPDSLSEQWTNWQAATGHRISAQSELYFPHMYLCVSAAVSGLGVALVERRFALNELKSGKLVERSEFLTCENGFVAVIQPGRALSPAAGHFLEWLRSAFVRE